MFPFRELFSSLDELKRRSRATTSWWWWWSDSSAALANRDNPVETEGDSEDDGHADDPPTTRPDIEDHGVIAVDDEEEALVQEVTISGRRCAKGGGSVLVQLLKSNSSIPLMAKLFPHPVIKKKENKDDEILLATGYY